MLKQGLRKLRLTKRFLNKPIRPLGTSTPYWASILSLHSHKSWRGQRGLFQFRRAIRHQFSASEQAKRSEKQLSKDINLKPEVCYYKVLNISTSADFDSIKVSYLNLAKKFHPDVAKDQEEAKLKFQQISEAYSILSKPELRFRYDQALGIKDPTWTVEKDFEDEFENQEVFMEYIKGERNYEDEKQFRDLSLEEEKSDELYDYYRYKYLGRFKEHEQNQGNLSPFRDMSNSSTVDVDSKYKMDKGVYDRFREMKKERADAGVSQNHQKEPRFQSFSFSRNFRQFSKNMAYS